MCVSSFLDFSLIVQFGADLQKEANEYYLTWSTEKAKGEYGSFIPHGNTDSIAWANTFYLNVALEEGYFWLYGGENESMQSAVDFVIKFLKDYEIDQALEIKTAESLYAVN